MDGLKTGLFRKVKLHRRGVSSLEYAVLMAMIAVVLLIALASIGQRTTSLFGDVGDRIAGVPAPAGVSIALAPAALTMGDGVDTTGGIAVSSVTLTGPDAATAVLAISGPDSASFTLSGTDIVFDGGVLNNASPTDSDGNGIWQITVTTTDAKGAEVTASFTLTQGDVAQPVSSVSVFGTATVVLGNGGYVYTLADYLTVVDASVPEAPVYMGRTVSDSFIGGYYGATLSGDGNYVFSNSWYSSDGIGITNVTNPSNPNRGAFFGNDGVNGYNPGGIVADGNTFWTFNDQTISRGEFTPPATTIRLGSMPGNATLAGRVGGLARQGNYLYGVTYQVSTYGNDRFYVFDLDDPNVPELRGFIQDPLLDGADCVLVRQNIAYVCGRYADSIVVINIADPDAPVIIGSITHPMLDNIANMDFYGDELIVMTGSFAGITRVDISDPANPVVLGRVSHPDLGTSSYADVKVRGDYAYAVTSNTNYLAIFNLNP